MKRFEGKVALITGASRGIGRGIALRLAAEGADIVVNYRSRGDEAQEVAYLASDDADYVTGATLVIDGGFSINLDLRIGESDVWGK